MEHDAAENVAGAGSFKLKGLKSGEGACFLALMMSYVRTPHCCAQVWSIMSAMPCLGDLFQDLTGRSRRLKEIALREGFITRFDGLPLPRQGLP